MCLKNNSVYSLAGNLITEFAMSIHRVCYVYSLRCSVIIAIIIYNNLTALLDLHCSTLEQLLQFYHIWCRGGIT